MKSIFIILFTVFNSTSIFLAQRFNPHGHPPIEEVSDYGDENSESGWLVIIIIFVVVYFIDVRSNRK